MATPSPAASLGSARIKLNVDDKESALPGRRKALVTRDTVEHPLSPWQKPRRSGGGVTCQVAGMQKEASVPGARAGQLPPASD